MAIERDQAVDFRGDIEYDHRPGLAEQASLPLFLHSCLGTARS